jgi:hypothetical protein
MQKNKEFIIPKIGIDNFDWSSWRAGIDIWIKLGIHARTQSILDNSTLLRKLAIGWISAERLVVRPKEDYMAVMFLVDGYFGWTHFTKYEFERIFSC